MPAEAMVRQADQLAADYRALGPAVAEQARAVLSGPAWSSVSAVYLVGAGDSFCACVAAELAFERLAGLPCKAVSAQAFADYAAPRLGLRAGEGRVAVVAASASGRTPEVVAAIEAANEQGALTIAVTGNGSSAVAVAAGGSVAVDLAGQERSPGIRSYQVTLLGLFTLAAQLSAASDAYLAELGGLADGIERTAGLARQASDEVAEAISCAPAALVLGSGPNLGTAMFGAAKFVEGLGTVALAQDLDEWWHIGRFVKDPGVPVFLIAVPGRSLATARNVAAAARQLGRQVIAVTDPGEKRIPARSLGVLPVAGASAREEFSPLLCHIFAAYTVASLARRRGYAFDDQPAGLPRSLDGFGASASGLAGVLRRHLRPEVRDALPADDGELLSLELESLGLESVELASFIVDLEATFGVRFDEEMLTQRTFQTGRSVIVALRELIER